MNCDHEWIANSGRGGKPSFRVNRHMGSQPIMSVACLHCSGRTWLTEAQWMAHLEARAEIEQISEEVEGRGPETVQTLTEENGQLRARIAELEQDLQSTTDSLGHSSREAEAAIREKQELLAGVNLQLKEIERLRDRIAELESQLADYRENGASAVRHAPTSAHWSRELRRLFGDDARAGIDKIEAQVRTAGAEALEKMGERLRKMLKEGGSSTAWRYCFRQAADECETEARRLRGEGE